MLTIMYDDDDDDNEWRQPVFLKVFFWSDNKKAETGNWSKQAGYCEAESQSSVENLLKKDSDSGDGDYDGDEEELGS